MIFVKKENSVFFLFVFLGILIFFAQTKDFKLLFDGLTYAALAKNILKTGDWKTLHYSVESYANFYQHPPLAIWIQAIFYRAFGFSEAISRIFPSLCALGTLISVFSFTKSRAGISAAYFSALTLLTSTRFVKWGTNFYLDGIFAFFCFVGFSLWLKALKKETSATTLSFFSGLLLSLAFMTKGVIIAGPLAVVLGSLILFPSFLNLKKIFILILGLMVPTGLWIAFAGGQDYLIHYLHESVLGRSSFQGLSPHPWRNIFLLWWPWWPIAFWSLKNLNREKLLIALAAFSFPIGFTLTSGGYLEHYLTPFYPFAAVLVGIQISVWIPSLNEKWIERSWGVAILASLYLATVSPSVNPMKNTPVQEWIRELELLPPDTKVSVHQVVFTEESADIWYGLANILGKTEWQAIGKFKPSRLPSSNTILITKAGEQPDPAWQIAPCLQVRGYHFYSSPDLNVCSQ